MPTGKGPGYEKEYVRALLAGDRRRIQTCLKKNTYHTVKDAERAIEIRRQVSGKALRRYTCPYCGLYHITSQVEMMPMAA